MFLALLIEKAMFASKDTHKISLGGSNIEAGIDLFILF